MGTLAAAIGYALFFYSVRNAWTLRKRFFLGTLWFFSVCAVQLSWMLSLKYQGIYIVFVYLFLLASMGMQFGLFTCFVPKKPPFTIKHLLASASLWTLLEWGRMYFISGFTWNPAGLSLASTDYSIGLASIAGVYGLTFWVILTNLLAYRALFLGDGKKNFYPWVFAALFPYVFTVSHTAFQKSRIDEPQTLSVLLVQTALLPEEKEPYYTFAKFIHPKEQWKRIFEFLSGEKKQKIDLIVLPEAALPFSAYKPYFFFSDFTEIWTSAFGVEALTKIPLLKEPFMKEEFDQMFVTNSYCAKAIANYFDADVILGLDDSDERNNFNAAFHFSPGEKDPERYEKRVLVPLTEYLPFEWCRNLAKKYGIVHFFTPGKQAKVFQGKVPMSVSICYEETYSDLIRQGRLEGAELFVNVTNDGWFPNTSLPKQHFDHGRLRGVENGVPIVRATNTGVTGAIDAFGRVCDVLTSSGSYEMLRDALFVRLPLYSFPTLYTKVGDGFIVGFSLLFFVVFLRRFRYE